MSAILLQACVLQNCFCRFLTMSLATLASVTFSLSVSATLGKFSSCSCLLCFLVTRYGRCKGPNLSIQREKFIVRFSGCSPQLFRKRSNSCIPQLDFGGQIPLPFPADSDKTLSACKAISTKMCSRVPMPAQTYAEPFFFDCTP